MSGREGSRHMKRMMAFTTLLVFAMTFIVIGVFAAVRKKEERQLSSAGTTQIKPLTTEAENGSGDAYRQEDSSSGKTERMEAEETVISVMPAEGEDEEADIYLVSGNEKGSSKYDRTNRLLYTDSTKYTAEAVEKLDRYGLRITRNEIFARHGRMFTDSELQDYFNRQLWYVPRVSASEFKDDCLNEVEAYNVKLIRSYELKNGY